MHKLVVHRTLASEDLEVRRSSDVEARLSHPQGRCSASPSSARRSSSGPGETVRYAHIDATVPTTRRSTTYSTCCARAEGCPGRAVIFDFYGTLAEATAVASWRRPVRGARPRALGRGAAPAVERRADGIEHDEHSKSRDHYVAWQRRGVRQIIGSAASTEGDDDICSRSSRDRRRHADARRVRRRRPRCSRAPRPRPARSRSARTGTGTCSRRSTNAGLTGTVDVDRVLGVGRRPQAASAHLRATRSSELGVDAADVLFVGDTWTCDVEGPRQAGMRPVYIRRPHYGVDYTAPESSADDDRRRPHGQPRGAARSSSRRT